MNEELLKQMGFAAGGLLVGALGYRLLSGSPEPVYTGLGRAYRSGKDEIAAAIFATPEDGYTIQFEGKKGPVLFNPFPDFESPVFTVPFAAALYADDIAADLEYKASGPWAGVTNEAAETREKERMKG
jgi:hypothetical protein